MSFTSTNTDSNCVLFTHSVGRRGTRGARRQGSRLPGSSNGTALGWSAGLPAGGHAVAADQRGVEQGSACSWWPTLSSAAFLAAVEDPASPG
jgi:hypothetical protein